MRLTIASIIALSALVVTSLPAQQTAAADGLIRFTRDDTTSIPDPKGNVPVLIPQTPRVKVARKWNEKGTSLRLTIENTFRAPLLITGMQTSGSLYAVSYPSKIGVGDKAELVVAYAPGTAGDGSVDVINLLTDQGVKTIEVEHDREQVFALDKAQLSWSSGDTSPKVVYLAFDPAIAKPKKVRVLGETKSTAELSEVSGTSYAIVITPAGKGKFVVKVEFDPQIEGASAVIYCEVVG